MDARTLTFLGCRLFALFCALRTVVALPPLLLALYDAWPLTAGMSVRLLLVHAQAWGWAGMALLLWFGSARLSRELTRKLRDGGRVPRDLGAVVILAAGLLLLTSAAAAAASAVAAVIAGGAIDDEAWRTLAVAGADVLVRAAAGLWLIFGPRPFTAWMLHDLQQPAPKAHASLEEASLGELVGDLVGAAGTLGVRRVTEMVRAVRSEAEGVARRVVRSSIDAVVAAVEQRHLDFSTTATAADGRVAIVFSDMEGFTAMTEQLGDEAAHRVIQVHNGVVRKAVEHFGGQEVELQGDGFLLAFPDVAQALRCCTTIHRELAKKDARHKGPPIRVRIGVHCGTPIKEGDRFFGLTVILAARIAAQAHGGQTLVSQPVHDEVAASGDFVFDGGREAVLKGLTGTHRMYLMQ